MSHETQPDIEHSDELLLVRWNENALLESERAQVEQHLGSCRDCRELVADLLRESETEERSSATPSRSSSRIGWGLLLAAAAALLLWAVLPGSSDSHALPAALELALAGRPEEAFSPFRGGPLDSGELYVGVRLTDSGWVRLIAIDDLGELREIPLDRQGAVSSQLPGDSDLEFGPYPVELGDGRWVVGIVVLSSPERIKWGSIQGSGWDGSLDAQSIEELGRALGSTARAQSLR